MNYPAAILTAIAIGATGSAAWADDASDKRDCAGPAGSTPQSQVRACSAIIQAGRASKADLARAYFYRGKNVEDARSALADFTAAIALDPTYVDPLNERGVLFAQNGDMNRAMADFEAVLRIDPSDVEGRNNRGLVFMARGDLDRAIAEYDAALRVRRDARAFANRALAYREKNDIPRAISDFNEAIRTEPRWTDPYMMLAEIYMLTRDYASGIAILDRVLAIEPRNFMALLNQGGMFMQTDNFARAVAKYTEALKLTAGRPDARAAILSDRGSSYVSMGDIDRGMADLNEAIQIEPRDPLPYASRARAYVLKRDYDRAIADWDQAIRLAPTIAKYYEARGEAKIAKGDKAGGEADIARGAEMRAARR